MEQRVMRLISRLARELRKQAEAMHGCHGLYFTSDNCDADDCLEAWRTIRAARRLLAYLRARSKTVK